VTRWLRREAPALVVVVVLGAVAVWWTLRLDWWPYQDTLPSAATVGVGGAARLESASFTVTGTRVVPGGSDAGRRLEVADDATLVVVSLEVTPDADDPLDSCELALVDGGAQGPRWRPASFTDTTYSPPDRFESYCDAELTAPYALQELFVVPSAVAGRVDLEITTSLTRPVPSVRLALDAAPGG
jgi:hypothetical protein